MTRAIAVAARNIKSAAAASIAWMGNAVLLINPRRESVRATLLTAAFVPRW